ncbi:hypothetical protein AB1Y20_021577 [Prymnesium parvum]|uniref:Fibronectin type-III domain-containing protein n=1 Tax=Prymnesium parvum TaxID=97485 RepID=A0AB34JK81_PRYPA
MLASSCDSVTFAWGDVEAEGYTVVIEDGAVDAPPRQPITTSATHLQVSGLRSAHHYTFRVAASPTPPLRSAWAYAPFDTAAARHAPLPPLPPLLEFDGPPACRAPRLRIPGLPVGCGSPSEWILQYRRANASAWVERERRSSVRLVEVDDLPANHSYAFRLVASNAVGRSAPGGATPPVFVCRPAGEDQGAAPQPLPRLVWWLPLPLLAAVAAVVAVAAVAGWGAWRLSQRGRRRYGGGVKYQRARCTDAWEDSDGEDAPIPMRCLDDTLRKQHGASRAVSEGSASLKVRVIAPDTSPHPIHANVPLRRVCSMAERQCKMALKSRYVSTPLLSYYGRSAMCWSANSTP